MHAKIISNSFGWISRRIQKNCAIIVVPLEVEVDFRKGLAELVNQKYNVFVCTFNVDVMESHRDQDSRARTRL